MSLKTTNKEARLAIRQYILDHFDPCGYDFTGPCSFPNVARFILSVHAKEKAYSPEYQSRKGYTNEQVFIDRLSLILAIIITAPPWLIWGTFCNSRNGNGRNIPKNRRNGS